MKTSCHPNHSLTSLAFHTHTQTAIASYCILFRYSLRRHKQQDVGCQVPIRAVQLPSTADKPHVDPTGSRQDHTNIFKLHSLSGAHISPAVMSFAPLKAGERPHCRYFFLFFTMEHQLGVCGEIASLTWFKSAGAATEVETSLAPTNQTPFINSSFP